MALGGGTMWRVCCRRFEPIEQYQGRDIIAGAVKMIKAQPPTNMSQKMLCCNLSTPPHHVPQVGRGWTPWPQLISWALLVQRHNNRQRTVRHRGLTTRPEQLSAGLSHRSTSSLTQARHIAPRSCKALDAAMAGVFHDCYRGD